MADGKLTRSQAFIHAVWLSDGDDFLARALLKRLDIQPPKKISAGLADSAFCGRAEDWKFTDSVKALLVKPT